MHTVEWLLRLIGSQSLVLIACSWLLANILTIKSRVAWWFKHHGKGSSESITLIIEYLKACVVDVKHSKPIKVVNWSPPINDVLKFNVDGAVRIEEGCAGIGEILHNSKGVVLCSFFAFVGKADAISTELWAIHKACCLCMMRSSLIERNIQIVTDSQTTVS
ncbi:hypothetical protein Ddye_014738 [Dipteronia dyeriana]|uniref:RNase H type-1 domain-containing protein n=1 Tax=Dipteronia dyeriana TaxID=168575 RepID=A0AAE0CKV0_9ROSI|nr:hypothetical protein Ddye_014738 [Dipteronia dyeriana]